MKNYFGRIAAVYLGASLTLAFPITARDLKTENVFLITTDGLRWQEVFSGADTELIEKDTGDLGTKYWRETPEARREVLMPFLWSVVVKEGQIFGNQKKGSVAQVLNGRNFSYPGYNELLTGYPNANITSNAKVANTNFTVLEWLHRKPRFANRVAAFSAWDVIPFIINRERASFPVMGGWEPLPERRPNEREKLLNELIADMTRQNAAEVDDTVLFHAAYEHLKRHRPRVFMVGFLETDHWGHAGRYGDVLLSARRFDDFIRRFWEFAQAHRQYRGKTTFVITTDHGRGDAPVEWKNHGAKVPGAENIWMAFLGPDTPALGERQDTPPLTQGQVAATIAALLGEDYRAAVPLAAPPILEILPRE